MRRRSHRENKKWSTSWNQNIRSRDVGENLRLVPYWERGINRSHRIEVVIDPGAAFGSGDHPSTLMGLELLEMAVSRARCEGSSGEMLDAGTGTGVLAIAGRLLGTGFTVGLDIDPAAIFTARRNLRLNGLCRSTDQTECGVELIVGSLDAVRGTFGIVVANLAAPVLLRLFWPLVERTGRSLILSGIADAMADEVIARYCSSGLRLNIGLKRDAWNAVWFEKEG